MTGPNLAREIAERQPSGSVVASTSLETAERLQTICHTPRFRAYTNTDVVGCELGGATKNVIALAVGMAVGLGLGANATATVITRGLAESSRLGVALGADPYTFSGLAGLGDLVATCNSPLSRNRTFGEQLGRGHTVAEITASTRQVAEGVKSCASILGLAQRAGVEMPIVEAVKTVIDGTQTPPEMITCADVTLRQAGAVLGTRGRLRASFSGDDYTCSYVRQSARSEPAPTRTASAVHSSDELWVQSARWQAPTWETTRSRPPLTSSGMKVAQLASVAGRADGDGGRVAGVLVVVGTAVHRTLGDGGQIHQARGHRDLRNRSSSASRKALVSVTVTPRLPAGIAREGLPQRSAELTAAQDVTFVRPGRCAAGTQWAATSHVGQADRSRRCRCASRSGSSPGSLKERAVDPLRRAPAPGPAVPSAPERGPAEPVPDLRRGTPPRPADPFQRGRVDLGELRRLRAGAAGPTLRGRDARRGPAHRLAAAVLPRAGSARPHPTAPIRDADLLAEGGGRLRSADHRDRDGHCWTPCRRTARSTSSAATPRRCRSR